MDPELAERLWTKSEEWTGSNRLDEAGQRIEKRVEAAKGVTLGGEVGRTSVPRPATSKEVAGRWLAEVGQNASMA